MLNYQPIAIYFSKTKRTQEPFPKLQLHLYYYHNIHKTPKFFVTHLTPNRLNKLQPIKIFHFFTKFT